MIKLTKKNANKNAVATRKRREKNNNRKKETQHTISQYTRNILR